MEALRPALRDALLDLVKQRETDLRAAGDKHAANNVYSLGVELGSIPTDYNGWTNYPTWCVNLWLSNDEPLYRETLEIVSAPVDILNTESHLVYVEEERRPRIAAADRLRDFVEDLIELGRSASLLEDLLGYVLGEVDWFEIADAWLETAAEAAMQS